MDVMIIATKACIHRKNLEKELKSLHIPYRTYFIEDHLDLVAKLSTRHSQDLIVNDEVVFTRPASSGHSSQRYDEKPA